MTTILPCSFSRNIFLFLLFSYCTISLQWIHPWAGERERRCLKIERKKTLKCCYIAHLSQPSSGREIHHCQADGNSPHPVQTVSKLRDMAKGETDQSGKTSFTCAATCKIAHSPTRVHLHTCVPRKVCVSGHSGMGARNKLTMNGISLDFVLERVGCILIESRASRPWVVLSFLCAAPFSGVSLPFWKRYLWDGISRERAYISSMGSWSFVLWSCWSRTLGTEEVEGNYGHKEAMKWSNSFEEWNLLGIEVKRYSVRLVSLNAVSVQSMVA